MKSDKYIEKLFEGAKATTFENARNLRKKETEAERLLWERLRGKGLHGYKFRRQHPIAGFVADFYCAKKRLVVELDGNVHNNRENRDYDRLRTELLEDARIFVMRFYDSEVIRNIDKVLMQILRVLESL